MNNTDDEFILRIQDKCNSFIFVDKKTDEVKEYEQNRKRSFDRVDFGSTSSDIQNVKQLPKKE